MARRSGFLHAMMQAQRQAERNRITQINAQQKAQSQIAKAAAKAQKDYENAVKSDQKERARLYVESRIAQVDVQNEQLEQDVARLNNLLIEALAKDPFLDLNTLKQPSNFPLFSQGELLIATPLLPPWQSYLPPEPTGLQKLLPGAKEKHAQQVVQAQALYNSHFTMYSQREADRQRRLAEAQKAHERQVWEARQKVAAQHAEINDFQKALAASSPSAIVNYFTMVLEASDYPEGFPQTAKVAYVPESKQLVVEYDLPHLDIVSPVSAYKYTKMKDVVTETARPLTQRKVLYTSVVAQVTLRTLYELFKADRMEYLSNIVFNGYVSSIDKGTGRSVRTCVVTVRTSRGTFLQLSLSHVDPQACLAVLNASVSKSPGELVPVRPVLEFNMVDPRFIEEVDVLSGLDQRPNLMELTPSEFESLITNLFQKMGLETRLTQASRDGGVDCVAFDTRPIFGGKVVIQAKRYKNTVGVSAVRDLYGTMLNEGASKGILVSTSGYGQASYDFAEGKPLELFSGSHLLHMLSEYAGIEAKIVMPDQWKDPQPDT